MIEIYEVCKHYFTSRELCVQSLKLSWHKVAKVTPNALLTQCTIVFNDTSVPNEVVEIKPLWLRQQPEHL